MLAAILPNRGAGDGILRAMSGTARNTTLGFTLAGAGAILAGEQEIALEPGVAVFIPPGLMHQIRADGPEPMELVTVFSPPVVPGVYDPHAHGDEP